ncbi:MAG TPA: 50S ribosomal protein L21 [Candidatus Woesebacteria bacterium]|mgnify:CR=1 FL=1|nr:50S ribosomal protein L21 [Candidatus Woesebacteria bacterium]
MMKYAVISLAGSQYLVEEGQILTVPKTSQTSSDQILLTVDNDRVKIGRPIVKEAKVDFEILKNYQGPKITTFRYKGKSRYRKTRGFRPQLTDLKITKITN